MQIVMSDKVERDTVSKGAISINKWEHNIIVYPKPFPVQTSQPSQQKWHSRFTALVFVPATGFCSILKSF